MNGFETENTIRTLSDGSTSTLLIAYDFANKVPVHFQSMGPMEFALIELLTKIGDDVAMSLVRWRSHIVLKIHILDAANTQQIKNVLDASFNCVAFCADEADDQKEDEPRNAEEPDELDDSGYGDADIDSANDAHNGDYRPGTRGRGKKDPKLLKRERLRREKRKRQQAGGDYGDHQREHIPMPSDSEPVSPPFQVVFDKKTFAYLVMRATASLFRSAAGAASSDSQRRHPDHRPRQHQTHHRTRHVSPSAPAIRLFRPIRFGGRRDIEPVLVLFGLRGARRV